MPRPRSSRRPYTFMAAAAAVMVVYGSVLKTMQMVSSPVDTALGVTADGIPCKVCVLRVEALVEHRHALTTDFRWLIRTARVMLLFLGSVNVVGTVVLPIAHALVVWMGTSIVYAYAAFVDVHQFSTANAIRRVEEALPHIPPELRVRALVELRRVKQTRARTRFTFRALVGLRR